MTFKQLLTSSSSFEKFLGEFFFLHTPDKGNEVGQSPSLDVYISCLILSADSKPH